MKDPLEYLNDVKIDLSEYDETQLNDIEKQRIKSRIRKTIAKNGGSKKPLKLVAKVSGLIAVLTVCTLTFGVFFPTYAEKIPGLREVISFLNRNNEIDGYEEVSTPIMRNVKSEGYDLNIESVYYNGKELTIFYNVIGKEKLNQNEKYWFDADVDLDIEAGYLFDLENSEFIDEYTFAGMVTLYISPNNERLSPEKLNCTLNFTRLYIGDFARLSPWNSCDNFVELEGEPLELSLDSSNIEVKEYEINKKVVFNDRRMDIIKAKEYPTEIFIELKNYNSKFGKSISYIIWDSNKGQLSEVIGSDTEEGNVSWKYRLPAENSEVYFIPYGSGEIIEPERYLITLEKSYYDLDENGTLEILDIYDEDNKTFMRVRATGMQATSFFGIRGDNKEDYYSPLYSKDKNILGLLDMEVTYVFNKLDREKNYYLQKASWEVILLEDQIIKIK